MQGNQESWTLPVKSVPDSVNYWQAEVERLKAVVPASQMIQMNL